MSVARLARIARRLSAMSVPEIFTRSRQALSKRGDVLLYRSGIDPFRPTASALDERGPFFVDTSDVPRLLEILRRRMPGEAARIVADAGGIVNRRFDLLGYRGLDFGEEIDWFLDCVSGKRAPRLPWPAIPFLDFETVGDHKLTWELNRHQWMVTLAKACLLTGEASYSADLIRLWQSWSHYNPYPIGINWASTLEVAFRAYSWMWAAFLLEGTPANVPEFQRQVTEAIERSGWYINRYLSTYFAPNTHLLGEGAMLFLIGTRYPALRDATSWRRVGWEIVTQSAARQVRADGFYFEQSTYYHVYALDFFLHARVLAERSGMKIPAELDAVIHRMAGVLAQFSPGGALPRFGDDDGGRLFDGQRNRPSHMADPLSTAASLYGDAELKRAAAGLCEETLWLLGPGSEVVFDSLPAAEMPVRSLALPAAGIYAMVSPGPPPGQLFIDAGEQGALSAGHGHADALSVQFTRAGRLWLADPGTGWYVGGDSRRDKFRGTAAHNTITVDRLDQALPGPPFSWGPLPRVETVRWVTSEAVDFFEGRHFGYEHLPEPVVHRRWVVRLGALWLIRDVLEGRGVHDFEAGWHFSPGVEVLREHSLFVASDGCGETLLLAPLADESWHYTAETGEDSPVYGQSVPAPVVRARIRSACPAETAVILTTGGDVGGVLRRCSAPGSATVFEYLAEGVRRIFGFADGKQPWTFEERTGDGIFFSWTDGEQTAPISVGGTA
jgi:hypothetical protein